MGIYFCASPKSRRHLKGSVNVVLKSETAVKELRSDGFDPARRLSFGLLGRHLSTRLRTKGHRYRSGVQNHGPAISARQHVATAPHGWEEIGCQNSERRRRGTAGCRFFAPRVTGSPTGGASQCRSFGPRLSEPSQKPARRNRYCLNCPHYRLMRSLSSFPGLK